MQNLRLMRVNYCFEWINSGTAGSTAKEVRSRPVSRVLYGVETPRQPFLWDRGYPRPRATYPGAARATPLLPYLVLHRMGFAAPGRCRREGALLPATRPDAPPGRPAALSVFGGKITTYRRLAEHALDKLAPSLPGMGPAWTARGALPGGDIQDADFDAFMTELRRRLPWMDPAHLHGLARRHGTRVAGVVGDARRPDDLGRHFGAGLYAREIDWLRREEWARTAEDVLWRRTKAGLHLDAAARREVAAALAA